MGSCYHTLHFVDCPETSAWETAVVDILLAGRLPCRVSGIAFSSTSLYGEARATFEQQPKPGLCFSSNLERDRHLTMANVDIWQQLLKSVETRISRQNFEIWFGQIRPIAILEDEIRLEVPNRYFKDWITDNYRDLIHSELERITNRPYRLSFTYADDSHGGEVSERGEALEETYLDTEDHFDLSPDKTFDTFVVGSSNQFAHAAARAVADNPAQTYNPLFIFGTVGLGKTHLLNAIGNKIRQDRPSARIIYLSCEQFVNELINSLRYEKMNEFRNKYRDSCDALLVDDIQFLAGKVRTQEEFFYTFNHLHDSGKQIVVTSDKFPKEIQGLEERLRNRFEWGLIADIQPPDLETKVAILRKKAALANIDLPDDVALYIAKNSKSNVRELEGSLIRLSAASSLYKRPIDLAFAEEVLQQLLETDKPVVSVDDVINAVCRHFELKVVDIKSHRKHKHLVWPRQIAMYLSRKHTKSSFPDLGQRFGGRDHTTIIHAVKKVEERLGKSMDLENEIRAIERLIGL